MPATVSIVVRHKPPTDARPNPHVVTIGAGDVRLLLAALRNASTLTTPTVGELERAQDLIDLLSSVE